MRAASRCPPQRSITTRPPIVTQTAAPTSPVAKLLAKTSRTGAKRCSDSPSTRAPAVSFAPRRLAQRFVAELSRARAYHAFQRARHSMPWPRGGSEHGECNEPPASTAAGDPMVDRQRGSQGAARHPRSPRSRAGGRARPLQGQGRPGCGRAVRLAEADGHPRERRQRRRCSRSTPTASATRRRARRASGRRSTICVGSSNPARTWSTRRSSRSSIRRSRARRSAAVSKPRARRARARSSPPASIRAGRAT